MNIRKILFFGIILIFLVVSLILVSAKTSDSNDDSKTSFKEWLKNFFTGKENLKITGEVIEDEFTDYTKDYPIENIEKLQGQNLDFQTDLDTGILTISGTGENSIAKIQHGSKTTEFDLSGENSFLKIDSATGNIIEGKFKVSERGIVKQESFSFSDNQKLDGISSGSTISYKEGNLKIDFSEDYSGNYGGETLEIGNVKEFNIKFANAGKESAALESLNFKVKEEGSGMNFLNGEFSISQGEVSMEKGVWNFPDNSKINSLPSSADKILKITPKINQEIEAEMMVSGKNLILGKETGIRGLNKDISFDGSLGFNKGNVFVPAAEKYRTELMGMSIGSRGEISENTNHYLYFDESKAIISGKNNYILMTENTFKLKEGVGGNLDMRFSKESPYLEGFFSDNDHLGITSGALGEGGSLELKKEKGLIPIIDIKDGSLQVYNDGKKMNIIPETQSRSKQITLSNVESAYAGKGSVPLQIITDMNKKTDAGKEIKIETLFLDDRDKIYFRSNYGSTEDFVAVDHSLRDIIQPEGLILPEMAFGTRLSHEQIKLFESRDFAKEFALVKNYNKKMKTLQNNVGLEFENLVKDKFGIVRGEEILEGLRKTDNPENYLKEKEIALETFPSLDQKTTIKYYPEIVRDRENFVKILEKWKEKGYKTEDLLKLRGEEEKPGDIPRFGPRIYSDKFDVSASDWYKIFY